MRLDNYICARYPDVSISEARKLIAEEKVSVNGRVVKEMAWIPFLLVHEILALLISKSKGMIAELCTLPRGSGQAKAHEQLCREHPHLDPKRTIPLGLHGDGAPHQKKKQFRRGLQLQLPLESRW